MPSKNSKSSNMPRITVSIDPFDDTIINMMAENSPESKSEIIRNIVNRYIRDNPDALELKYGIIAEDVRRQIKLQNKERTVEDELEELIRSFKRIRSIKIDRLAEKLVMSSRTLLKLLDDYGDKLEEKGLNLIIDGDLIVKE